MRKPAGLPDRSIGWLTARADYLALANDKGEYPARKWITPYFVLQTRPQQIDATFAYRAGFTTSRKVGNAVRRNYTRRRLRELVRLHLPAIMQPGHDLVIVARPAAAIASFTDLINTLTWAINRLGLGEIKENNT